MGWLRNLERWLRKNVWNPAKRTVADELKANLDKIDAAVQKAVIAYAQSVGGEPFAFFVAAAIAQIGLSDAASKFVQGLIDRLGASTSRSVEATRVGREWNATNVHARDLMNGIRSEASKA